MVATSFAEFSGYLHRVGEITEKLILLGKKMSWRRRRMQRSDGARERKVFYLFLNRINFVQRVHI